MDKRNPLRHHFRKARNALSEAQQQASSEQLCERLLNLDEMKNKEHIAAYWDNDGEISLAPTIASLSQRGLALYLPQLHPFSGRSLLFCRYHPGQPMVHNKYGIPEPPLASNLIRPLMELDVLIMPLVAFDQRGNRLGMGGGFYDRTLARRPIGKPLLIGVAHDCQRASELPVASWDVPLDMIVTPSHTLNVGICD